MVGLLIGLRATVRGHGSAARRPWLLAAAVLGLAAAVGTVVLGVTDGPGSDLLSFVLALWVGGQVARAAVAGGDPILPPELLALLPVPARDVAAATLRAGLREPATAITALALLGVPARALGGTSPAGGLAATGVGIVAWALTVAFTVAATALAGAVVAPTARRGRDLATVVSALALGVIALGGTLLPLLLTTVRAGSSPTLATVIRVLPSSWGTVAVDGALDGDGVTVLAALGGLAVLTAGTAAALPAALARRIAGRAVPHHRVRRARRGHRLLPGSPTGAVVAKELRWWLRDPLRVTCLLVALVVGVGTAVVPVATSGTVLLLPFGGLLTVVIAAACAGNLHGGDGTTIWSTLLTPRSAVADIRGRQLAWVLIVAPAAAVVGISGVAVSHLGWALPWVLALTPALLGGGAGILADASTRAVLPLDPTGGPTPAISVKVHLCLYAVTATALPAAALLVLGTALDLPVLTWSATPVAVGVGLALAHVLGAAAARRVAGHEADLLAAVRPVLDG